MTKAVSKPIKRPVVKVEKLMKVSPQELNQGLKTNLTVVFSDGVKRDLTFREVVINRYVWELLNRYPGVPVLSTFDITNYYVNGYYVTSTMNQAYEVIMEYLIHNVLEPSGSRSELKYIWEIMQKTFNAVYNELVFTNLDYITSLDINMFLDVQLNPELVKAMREVTTVNINNRQEVMASIENTYKVLHKILNSEEYHGNKIAQGYISKAMRPTQLRQVLASRGNITNLYDVLFKTPIASSFTSGLYNIAELAMESHTGAKALKATNTAVSDSEFFARKLQLVMSRVERVVDGDCGNHDYVDWYVSPEIKDGETTMPAHLPFLVGKYYFNEETKSEELITRNHTNLIGKTIKLRVAYKCKHRDKRVICSKCMGHIAYNLPAHCHIGHFSVTIITDILTQKILSLKHEISSANTIDISINKEARRDFETKPNDNEYVYLKRRHVVTRVGGKREVLFDNKKHFSIAIKVAVSSARGLSDITPSTDVKRFSPIAVSVLYDMWLVKTNKETGEVKEISVDIKKDRRRGSFTTEFLLHIQKVQYDMDGDDNIIIPIDDWDMSKPIIMVPDVEFSYLSFGKAVAALFGANKNVSRRTESTDEESEVGGNSQDGFLYRLFTEINKKLNINIALLEVIVAGFSVTNYEADDFTVAHGADTASVRNIKTILCNSSAGAFYAYQEHLTTMTNPKIFRKTRPVNYILDVLLAPKETLEDYESNPIQQ